MYTDSDVESLHLVYVHSDPVLCDSIILCMRMHTASTYIRFKDIDVVARIIILYYIIELVRQNITNCQGQVLHEYRRHECNTRCLDNE